MLSPFLHALIDAEIALELYSASLYRSLAGWAHLSGLPRLEKHYTGKVAEETAHADRFRAFIEKHGRLANLSAIDAVPAPPGSLEGVLEAALAHEQMVSRAIDEMVTAASAELAHAAHALFLDFAEEQVEEEDEARSLLALARNSDDAASFDAGLPG